MGQHSSAAIAVVLLSISLAVAGDAPENPAEENVKASPPLELTEVEQLRLENILLKTALLQSDQRRIQIEINTLQSERDKAEAAIFEARKLDAADYEIDYMNNRLVRKPEKQEGEP